MSRPLVRYQLRRPELMTDEERAELGALILSGFPLAHRYYSAEMIERLQTQAWRVVPAALHCVAYAAEQRPIGQQSLFRLHSPDLRVYGLSDVVVAEPFRGFGIANELARLAVDEARKIGAQAICTSTTKLAGVFSELGFSPDEGESFVAGDGEPIPNLLVWLAEGVSVMRAPLTPSDF